MRLFLFVFPMVFVAGCQPEAELVTGDCTGIECPTCAADAECVVLHNPCQEVATCAHRDAPFAVTQEGCSAALEYGTPPAEACTCVDEGCAAQ